MYIHMGKLESDAGCRPVSLLIYLFFVVAVLRQGFSVALEPVVELVLVAHLIFLRQCLSLNLEFIVWAGLAKTQLQHGVR